MSDLTYSVLMVRPIDFDFNEETAGDNEFQQKPKEDKVFIRTQVLKEFDNFVQILRNNGIQVVVHDKSYYPELRQYQTPDAVFPNNWISTENNNIYIFPMYAENRKLETKSFPYVKQQFDQEGLKINAIVDLRENTRKLILEGTGSMIYERKTQTIYASESCRTNRELLETFCKDTGFNCVAFKAQSTSMPYYHTNVILAIGSDFIVICEEAIDSKDRERVMTSLASSGKEIIIITAAQVNNFCGNVIQLKNKQNEKFIIMSTTALNNFTHEQQKKLTQNSKILAINIETIEKIGGGSARCMVCELYL